MQQATRRNLMLLAVGIAFLLLLWQVPGRRAPASQVAVNLGTPRPTPTVESQWQPLLKLEASGPHDFCAAGQEFTVPGPWRIRATPADRDVEVRVIDKRDGQLFARVWAAGTKHGSLATLPQGNGTFCLQVVQAEGDYTLWVEAWQAPQK